MKEVTGLIMAGALMVIAVLMVTGVILWFRNGSLFGGLSGGSETGTEITESSLESPVESSDIELVMVPEPGLNQLDTGEIVYVLSQDERESYDEANIIEAGTSGTGSPGEAAETIYYLANSWLELDEELYYFDEEGHACTGSYSERAFNFGFDEDGHLSSIRYNQNYSESPSDSSSNYQGLVQTRALSVFMDPGKTLGAYVSIKYKRATESLTYYLGRDANTQYASPYAYDIADGRIYYLALQGRQYIGDSASASSAQDLLYDHIAGKVFCMTPGTEERYIAAEDALGFKLITDEDGDTVVYYDDGDRIQRSTDLVEDEDMVVFSEDAEYRVDIETSGRAYLELSTGQRVTLASDTFRAGNFTYALSAEGEILSVAEKTTVSMGGYVYEFQNGSSFGVDMTRLTRQDSGGTREVISGEVTGRVANIHYDYDSSSIIAEYVDNNGGGGLLKARLDGDIDIITESRITSGTLRLYGISEGIAIYQVTDGDETLYQTAAIASSSPLAVAIDPVPIDGQSFVGGGGSNGDDGGTSVVGSEPGEPQSPDDYDDTVQGQAPPIDGPGSDAVTDSQVTTGPGADNSGVSTNPPGA